MLEAATILVVVNALLVVVNLRMFWLLREARKRLEAATGETLALLARYRPAVER